MRGEDFVFPRSSRWPFQSLFGDLMQFFAISPFARLRPVWSGKVLLEERALPDCDLGRTSLRTRWVLSKIHHGAPPPAAWLSRDWVPRPIEWQLPVLARGYRLRFCSQCIKRGYHSPIHLLPWITHCPLHPTFRLKSPCLRCRRVAWEGYASSTGLEHCGLGLANTSAVVLRGVAPKEGVELMLRYTKFVNWCRTVDLHHAGEPSVFSTETNPNAGRGDADLLDFVTDRRVATAVTLLIRSSPFSDLCETIAKSSLDGVHQMRVPRKLARGFTSAFGSKSASLAPRAEWDAAIDVPPPGSMTPATPVGCRFKGEAGGRGEIVRAATAEGHQLHNEVNATRAVQKILNTCASGCHAGRESVDAGCNWIPLHSVCVLCHAVHLWKRHIFGEEGLRPFSMLMWPARLGPCPPKPRDLQLPASPEADQLRYLLLLLDLQEYFLCIRDWYLHRGFDPERSHRTLRTRFQSVVGIGESEAIRFYWWDLPQLKGEVTRTRRQGRCEFNEKRVKSAGFGKSRAVRKQGK